MRNIDWDYFDRFNAIIDKYMPSQGEGEILASQIVTAANKLVYKWYNDGDVYDNTHYLGGWGNDLSSYANWLDQNTDCGDILSRIDDITTEAEYEELLADLCDMLLDENYLSTKEANRVGTIYKCVGRFSFIAPEPNCK